MRKQDRDNMDSRFCNLEEFLHQCGNSIVALTPSSGNPEYRDPARLTDVLSTPLHASGSTCTSVSAAVRDSRQVRQGNLRRNATYPSSGKYDILYI